MKHKKKLFGLGIGMAAAIALGSAPAKQASAAAYTGVQEELLVQSADLLKDTKEALRALETVVAEVPETEGKEQAFFFMQKVVPAMEALRKPVDELEMIVNKNMWPMPSYGDLLFEV